MAHGRPGPAPQTAKREQFARLIARGTSNAEACRIVGVNPRTGKRWRHGRTITSSSGAKLHYPPVTNARKQLISETYLSEDERVRIADLRRSGLGVRAIARAVGADPGLLIAEYDAAHQAPRPVTAADLLGPARPVKIRERHRLNWGAVLALALVATLGVAGYHVLATSRHAPVLHIAAGAGQHRAIHRHARAAPPPAPAATPPLSPYAHKVVIHLAAIEDCWVGFTTPVGGYLFQSYVVAGTSKRWAFRHPVDMRLGNPGGIRLTVDGKNPLPPGTAGPITLSLGLDGKISS